MEAILEKFIVLCEDPYGRLNDWKIENRKEVIGCLPMYVPEELIAAAGMLPVILLGSMKSVTKANKHLLTMTCEELRSTYDMLLNGRFEFIDGVVMPLICDQIRFAGDLWDMDHPFPFFHQIWLSARMDDLGKEFLMNEFHRFKEHLEEYSGREISSHAIEKSIHTYNQNRALLRRLYELKGANPALMTADDFMKVVISSMTMPKETHTELLVELVSAAEELKAPDTVDKTPLLLLGHPCAAPEKELIDLIEELGGVIIDDDLYTGYRYFSTDAELNGNPMESLADRFMKGVPCPIKHHPGQFKNEPGSPMGYPGFIIDFFKKSKARGILFLQTMFCDPYDWEFPSLKERLEEERIPFQKIATGLESHSIEPLRTRLAAFLEVLEK